MYVILYPLRLYSALVNQSLRFRGTGYRLEFKVSHSASFRVTITRISIRFKLVYLQKPTRTTKQYHPRRFVRIGSTGDQQKPSFFVRTIKDWNDLPPGILGIDDYEAFKTSLIVHRSQ